MRDRERRGPRRRLLRTVMKIDIYIYVCQAGRTSRAVVGSPGSLCRKNLQARFSQLTGGPSSVCVCSRERERQLG